MNLQYRTVWISDVHLGARAAKAPDLLEFLERIRCENLYLVGDIVDLWELKSGFYWPAAHNKVARRILNMAKQGTRVVCIPGNHDDLFRKYTDLNFNGIEIKLNAVHETADGRKFLVMHGDEFDTVVCHQKRLTVIGGKLYDALIRLNRWVNVLRETFGYNYWSLSRFLKYKVKNAVAFIQNYQLILSLEARERNLDGVICGHIHHAEIAILENNITYCNCGDWVESCTAIAEGFGGEISLVRWLEEDRRLPAGTEWPKAA